MTLTTEEATKLLSLIEGETELERLRSFLATVTGARVVIYWQPAGS